MQTWTTAVVTVDRARISPGDAVAHRADSAELFDIEMDELARMLAFITPYRFGRLQGTELFNPSRRRTRLTVAGETPVSEAICLPVRRWRRSRSISTTTAWGVGRCSRCGRDERSCNPASPSRRCRSTHLRTVRGQMPAASATASDVCPLATCRTMRSRPRGVGTQGAFNAARAASFNLGINGIRKACNSIRVAQVHAGIVGPSAQAGYRQRIRGAEPRGPRSAPARVW
jgi:hypothetical protein